MDLYFTYPIYNDKWGIRVADPAYQKPAKIIEK